MKFKNKTSLIEFIKNQLSIELINDTSHVLNKKRNLLYTKIPSINIIRLLNSFSIRHEKHMNDYYWIFLK